MKQASRALVNRAAARMAMGYIRVLPRRPRPPLSGLRVWSYGFRRFGRPNAPHPPGKERVGSLHFTLLIFISPLGGSGDVALYSRHVRGVEVPHAPLPFIPSVSHFPARVGVGKIRPGSARGDPLLH